MTPTATVVNDDQDLPLYQSGFDNTFESEAVPGSLPKGRNNPRQVPFGLYAEQLSGTTFFGDADPSLGILNPNPLRWMPFEDNNPGDGDGDGGGKKTFVTGMHLIGAAGEPPTKNGIGIYVYMFQKDMDESYLYNSDGDFLIVPQEGALCVRTELGILHIRPKEICVIPRGIVFSVHRLPDPAKATSTNSTFSRGYVLEVYKGHFVLPELGPIGSNGLANVRDFLYPTAWYEPDLEEAGSPTLPTRHLYNKFGSRLWSKPIESSPFNVVAWHGNYLPFKYDLSLFCAINSVSYDHMDPSIYTVLTCAGDETGTALCDFVIFPPRWMSTDPNTFRPPWFHRNTMTEFMGNIYGSYDAKKGFLPGGASLHSCMTPHGPDAISYAKSLADPCEKPTYFSGGLSFMFETSCMLRLTKFALTCDALESDYGACWKDLPNQFDQLCQINREKEQNKAKEP